MWNKKEPMLTEGEGGVSAPASFMGSTYFFSILGTVERLLPLAAG